MTLGGGRLVNSAKQTQRPGDECEGNCIHSVPDKRPFISSEQGVTNDPQILLK